MSASTTDASEEAAAEGTQPGDSTSNGSDSHAGQDVDIEVAAVLETTAPTAAPDAAAHAAPALPTEARNSGPTVPAHAGKMVLRVEVQNKQLRGVLLLERYPWVVQMQDGRQVSPSEFERQAGSLRKNWKSSTYIVQADGMVGMPVGSWLDTMGIINPKAAVKPARPAAPPADSARQSASAGPPAKRVRKLANPEKHLAELKALLAAHGKQLDGGWKVEYTEIKRADGIDMDPHYIAPEGFQPDMTELPAGSTSRSYYSRKKVAQAHGILSADLLSKRASTTAPPEKRARAEVKKQPKHAPAAALSGGNAEDDEDEGYEDDEEDEDEPPAKRTRTAAAAHAILSSRAPNSTGPLSPSTQTQNATAEALMQLASVDPPQANGGASHPGAGKAPSSGQHAVPESFKRTLVQVMSFVSIVEFEADTMKRRRIKGYMQQAKSGLEALIELRAVPPNMKSE